MFIRIGIAFVTYGLVLVGLGLIAAQPAQA